MRDNVWCAFWIAVASVILGLGFFIWSYNVKANDAIAHAQTCEQAVLLENNGPSANVTNQLFACRIKITPTSGKE